VTCSTKKKMLTCNNLTKQNVLLKKIMYQDLFFSITQLTFESGHLFSYLEDLQSSDFLLVSSWFVSIRNQQGREDPELIPMNKKEILVFFFIKNWIRNRRRIIDTVGLFTYLLCPSLSCISKI